MSDQRLAPKNGLDVSGQPDAPADALHAAPRVLVVDDDPGQLLLMRETLAEAGFDVSDAASGPEAIELCSKFEPDLMLLDINMPSMDGITACIEIRKRSEHDFPIIMVTSVDDSESIQRAFDAGATDFILKPVNWPLFQRRLDSVLAEWNRAQEFDASNRRVKLLEKVVPEQVMLVSRSGVIIEDLKRRQGSGRADTESPDQTLTDLYGADVARRMQQRISGVLKTGHHNNLEFSVTEYGFVSNFEAQFLVEGRDRVIIVVQNASGDKQSQDEVFDLAFFDSVTQLPNRHLFERYAEENLVDARLQGRSLAILSLCFDNISEEHQSDPGMTQTIAARISACLSTFDSVMSMGDANNAAQVSRVDSNRFRFIVAQEQEGNDMNALCDRIAQQLEGSIESDSGPVTFSPRLGIARFPADGQHLQAVMHAADSALHEAIEIGKSFCFYSQAALEPDLDTQDYGDELRRALEAGQLELYFQPRLSLPCGTITCVEALLRWDHPVRGFVDLRELLYLAKVTGLIVPLGNWVLRQACEQARRWRCDPAPSVSINLSQQEFSRQDLSDRVIEILEQTGLEPGRMDLELTEAALLRTGNGLAELEVLKKLGVGLVLDNFGTGHSSLARLKQYPIDALKIDGSFIRNLPASEEDAAVCEVIITMAHLFGMKAVAEGVETEEQLGILQKMGCDEFQGYHICRPLPADDIADYLSGFGKHRH